MSKHVYPPWHKPIQQGLFVIGAILVIVLSTYYGYHRRTLSPITLAIVFSLYFGFWIVFTLVVRFLLPSYAKESALPIHTPSPLPPPILHTPPKADAQPSAPALKIRGVVSESNRRKSHLQQSLSSSARFADEDSDDNNSNHNIQINNNNNNNKPNGLVTRTMNNSADESLNSRNQPSSSLLLPQQPDQQQQSSSLQDLGDVSSSPSLPRFNSVPINTVTFQPTPSSPGGTRPRGLTTDSTNSDTYPTFAAYRQAQHGSIDVFALRIKNRGSDSNGGGSSATSPPTSPTTPRVTGQDNLK